MRTSGTDSMDQLAIDTIRTLAMRAVEAAESGHPGTPMGRWRRRNDGALHRHGKLRRLGAL